MSDEPENRTERFLRLVTHPTQIIRRSDVRAVEQASTRRISPRLSGLLLIGAAVSSFAGIGIGFLGVLIHVVGLLLLGVLLLAGGMAAASLEGLLLPERDGLLDALRRAVNR